ncbi:hypothetical protein EKM05_11910 [Flavobacterium sp. GSP27]|uniref:hypothetical protein n=1 Tax=Flavobacterium sp. GSP27 TaxID=2497489 RepID=UPI000F83F3A7|nr:hypothetical protein [Flavobacterium sp. GSP27]RTZ06629.1 hypothetical protein EKM05_11910 [Flavobacterium sp. GSP27]
MEWEGKTKDAPIWVNRSSSVTLEGGNVTFEMDGIPSLYRRTDTPSKRLKTPEGVTYVQSEYLNEINKKCFIEMLLTDRMQVRIIEDDGSIFQMNKDLVDTSNDKVTTLENSANNIESDCTKVQNEFIACASYNQELLQEINTLKNQQLISQSEKMTILSSKAAENVEKALDYLKKSHLKIQDLQDKLIEKDAIILKLSRKINK